MNPLSLDYAKVTSRPYQPTYIEFEGYLMDEKPTGFAMDYDGLIYINNLIKTPQSLPEGCD